MEEKDLFKSLISTNVTRNGIEDLMSWLDKTDFYTAPASTRFHGSFEGGLLKHSIAVYLRLNQLIDAELIPTVKQNIPAESVAICALFHDLCKINCYKTEMRWRKDKNQRWEQYPTYKFEEDFAFGGHGSKSVYLLSNFIKLTPEEASAINSHMGAWEKTTYNNPSAVYEQNALAWLLHVADEMADFIDLI